MKIIIGLIPKFTLHLIRILFDYNNIVSDGVSIYNETASIKGSLTFMDMSVKHLQATNLHTNGRELKDLLADLYK